MSERTAAYESLVQRTGLDPAVIRAIEIGSARESRIATVRRDERVRVPGFGIVHFVEDRSGTPIVSLPDGLEHIGTRFTPLVAPSLRAAPATRLEYWERRAAMAEKIAIFRGRLQIAGGRENGWLPIVERIVDAIAVVVGPADSATVICEVTFGMLSISIRAACDDPDVRCYVSDLGPWSEATAIERCMVSGEPGWRGPIDAEEPWEYTLSDRVRALSDPLASELIYPPPPEGE
jgi:hypothetical protein